MMRQAGRYMREYQDVKDKAGGFLQLCQAPHLAAQATLDAARILRTDAAIIFSDITLPALGMGMELEFSPGPRFTRPLREAADLSRLKALNPRRDLGYVLEAIAQTRAQLPDHVSLIGFVGAPLTMAAYMIEGYPSKSWGEAKKRIYGQPALVRELLQRLSEALSAHARAQVEAGCDAVQLFDTNAGDLMPAEREEMAFGYAAQVVESLQDLRVPIIYFARGVGACLDRAANIIKPDVLGIDWTVSLEQAQTQVPPSVALMGNLDPTVLFTTPSEIERRVVDTLRQGTRRPGYIFNLGHGILPETPVAHAKKVVETVRGFSP